MHTWLLVTKSNCTDFLVLVVILMCHALIFLIDQHIQQQGRYFNNQLLFLVFFLFIIYIMCKIFAHTILPLYQSYIIMGLGFFLIKKSGIFLLYFIFAMVYNIWLTFFKLTLCGSGYKCFVCTLAAFVFHLFWRLLSFWSWNVLFQY